jgi:type I restriction enzyme S subunit
MRAGWEIKTIGDVCDIFDRKRKPISKRDREPGPYPYYGASCIQDYVSGYLFDGRYLLIGEDGAKWGPGEDTAYIAEGKFWVNNHAHIVKAKEGYLDDYLRYYIKHLDLNPIVAGAIIPKLTQEKLAALEIPIPSLAEQQRIVDILDREFATIDALKANAEKSLYAAKDLFQATLKKELEPKEGWSDISIGSVASLITKGASPKWQGIQYVSSGGILFITSENVREGFIDISLPKYVETAFNGKQARSILQKDDVLVNIVGASIGRAAVYTLDVKDANVNQAVALVRLNKDRVFPDYLCCFLNSKMAEAFYTSMKKDTARANLSLENISNIVFPCPKDITEQKAVAKKLHYEQQLCRQVENNYQKALILCDDLKQSLLRKAFNGEL